MHVVGQGGHSEEVARTPASKRVMPKRTSGGASGSQGKKARMEPSPIGPRAKLESSHHVLVQALLKERYLLEDDARKVGGTEGRWSRVTVKEHAVRYWGGGDGAKVMSRGRERCTSLRAQQMYFQKMRPAWQGLRARPFERVARQTGYSGWLTVVDALRASWAPPCVRPYRCTACWAVGARQTPLTIPVVTTIFRALSTKRGSKGVP